MPEAQTLPRTFVFGEFRLNPQDGTLVHRGHKVRLQDQPFRLLALLVERSGEVVTREEIQNHLWPGNTYVEFDKSLRVAVNKVREALRDSADRPHFVETVPRRGYRFVAPVTINDPESPSDGLVPAAALPPTAVPASATDATPAAAPSTPASRRVGWRSLIALPLVLLLAVAWTLVLRRPHPQPSTPEVSAHPILRRSVAVVGLQNLSADPRDRWLSTALGEMLSAELSASENLRVISGEEVARAGLADPPANTPSHETLARYAHQLGADMIVYGSFAATHPTHQDAGDSLRLDLRLENFSSDAPSLVLIKAGKSSDLFALVTATGTDLRQRLGFEALTTEASSAVRRSLPADQTAAQFYAEGLNRLHLFDALGARALLQKAARIEPGHAGTHLALSGAWNALGYDKEALTEAQLAAKLSDGLPRQQVLAMQGQLALRSADAPRAAELYRTLFNFYPDNVDYGLSLAAAQEVAGNTRAALDTLQTLSWPGLAQVDQARVALQRANVELELGDFQQALLSSERADRIGRSLGIDRIRAQALQESASALERMSQNADSLRDATQAVELYTSAGDRRGAAVALLMRGDVLYNTGKLADARSAFQTALETFAAVGNKRSQGVTLERLGNVSYDQGELPLSRKYYGMALSLYRQLHIDGYIASAIANIANVQDAEGDIAGSIKSNQEGLALFERTADQRGVAVTLCNMGSIEMERGALATARSEYKRSADVNQKTGYHRGLAFSLVGQGDVFVAQNDLSDGIRLYQQALKLVVGKDEPQVLASVHSALGFAELFAGQPRLAIRDLEQALDLARKRGDHGYTVLTLAGLTRAQILDGNLQAAAAAADRAIAESKLQFAPPLNLVASMAKARAEIAQGQNAAARDKLRDDVALAQRYGYLPMALEARILLARTVTSPSEQRRLLNALAQEALNHGWKQLAVEARTV